MQWEEDTLFGLTNNKKIVENGKPQLIIADNECSLTIEWNRSFYDTRSIAYSHTIFNLCSESTFSIM